MEEQYLVWIEEGYLRGWRLTPLRGKRPVRTNWNKEEPADLETTRKWVREGYNLGLRTGQVSGVVVLDVDEAKGGRVPDGLPDTVTVSTGGGGRHFYFASPEGVTVPNSVGTVAPHVDIRGDGGQVVFPGSTHPETGKIYEWLEGHAPSEIDLAPFPDWLLKPPGKPETVKEQSPIQALEPYLQAAVDGEVDRMSAAVEGCRNPTLNQAAYALGTLEVQGLLRDKVEEALVMAAMSTGLGEKEARKTFASGWSAGAKKPRGGAVLNFSRGGAAGGQEDGEPPEDDPPPPAASGDAICGAENGWPCPIPLPESLPAVVGFNLNLLPEAFRDWLIDVCERLQVPMDYCAVGAMVALAGVTGRRCAILPKRHDNWLVVPNLWGAIVGPPGVMKSPALRETMFALRALESECRASHAQEMEEFNLLRVTSEIEVVRLKKQVQKSKDCKESENIASQLAKLQKLEPPKRVRFVINDATVEKLGEILNANLQGILMFRDELVGFLENLEKKGREAERAFYLEAWSGTDPFTYDRINRGTVEINAACVSVLGGIQPGPLRKYLMDTLEGGSKADGLLQRFQLLVYPDITPEWKNVDRAPNEAALNRAWQVFDRIAGLVPAEPNRMNVYAVRFDEQAQEEFDEWRSDLEHRVRRGSEHPALISHLAKFRSLVPSLALLIHLADVGMGAVDKRSLIMACGWAEYLESHARRVYSLGGQSEVDHATLLLNRIEAGDLPNPFTAREVRRKGWSGLQDQDEVTAALNVLQDHGYLRAASIGCNGRPSTAYHINPALNISEDGGTAADEEAA